MIGRLRKRLSKKETIKKPSYLRFNLLPQEYLERQKKAALGILRILAFGLIIAVVAFATIQQYIALWEYESATLDAETELLQYSEALQIEQELATYRQEYENRQRLVFGKAMPVPVHEVMVAVSDAVPHTVAITDLDIRRGGGLVVQGRTNTLYDVSHFASVLRDLEYLPEPVTIFTGQIEPPDVEGRIAFEMVIPWLIPEDVGGDAQ